MWAKHSLRRTITERYWVGLLKLHRSEVSGFSGACIEKFMKKIPLSGWWVDKFMKNYAIIAALKGISFKI
jgi:hypothetical protein